MFHEFAHQLDDEAGIADGTPSSPTSRCTREWARVLGAEYEALVEARRRDGPTLLDEYGAESPAEFFAVVTETFFEMPARSQGRATRSSTSCSPASTAGSRRSDPAAPGRRAAQRILRPVSGYAMGRGSVSISDLPLSKIDVGDRVDLRAVEEPERHPEVDARSADGALGVGDDVRVFRRPEGHDVAVHGRERAPRLHPVHRDEAFSASSRRSSVIQYAGLYSSTYVNPCTFGSKNIPVASSPGSRD